MIRDARDPTERSGLAIQSCSPLNLRLDSSLGLHNLQESVRTHTTVTCTAV